ncbi:MAG: T9SS type A sorting domain-containing protein [Candidatus Glassbacteria bacterium]|nr:T9SS type A sorting domain-containing protein [Candidatus Glassbacteria bacterium]
MKTRYIAYPAILAAAVLALAQQPVPLPVVVNEEPAGAQTAPVVISSGTGSILVAWRDSTVESEAIRLQGFDRLGHRLGPVREASDQVSPAVSNPCLSANVVGGAVLSWQERLASIDKVVFRRLNSDGSPRTGVLPLSTLRLISGTDPAVGIDSLGNVALVWAARVNGSDSDIYGNFFEFGDTTGTANQDTLAFGWIGEVQINEVDEGEQTAPAVYVDRKGRVLVAWRDTRPDSMGIFCRAFSSRGEPLGSFRLNDTPPGEITAITAPAVAGGGRGFNFSTFMVSWVETDTLDRNRLILAKIDLELFSIPPIAVVDTQFTQIVRSRTGLEFETPALGGDDDGSVALVWTELEAGQGQLYGVMFNSSSDIRPPALRLTSSDPGFGVPALHPSVGVNEGGSFAMAWEDTSGGDPDIRLQRYSATGAVDQPVYSSPGAGGGDNRSVRFLGRPSRGYEMYWEHDNGVTLQLLSVRYDFAGRPLAAPAAVYPIAGSQRRPVTADSRSGTQLLAWEEHVGNSYRVMATILREDGSVLREPFQVAITSTAHLGSLAAAAGNNGDLFLLWERWNQSSGAPDLVLARLDSLGNARGSAVTVAPASGGGGRLASAAVSPQGNLMVSWRQGAAAGTNAQIRARVYAPSGATLRERITVSRDTVEYVGGLSRPVVASSDSSGNFLVLWQEFYSDRNLLYYRLYDSAGDSLQLPGGQWRARLGSSANQNDGDRAYNSPAVAVDSAGGFLVLWSETDPTGTAGLYGARLDPRGAASGSQFQVPGVRLASLPVISILDGQRVAVAWQDTLGDRIGFLAVQLHFHSVLGRVLLASAAGSERSLMVHVDGVSTDSAALAPDGSFRFEYLLGGSYRVWVSADGAELPGTSGEIVLSATDPPVVDIGITADLRGLAPPLPSAGRIGLAQNVPNPFNPSTTVSFTVAESAGPVMARLAVYDLRGALVRNLLDRTVEPGMHRLEWDGRDQRGRQVSSGVYFLRLSAGGESRVRKMVLLK